MRDIADARSEKWKSALRLASRSREQLSANVVLEPNKLTVALSNGRSYSAPRTVSDESAIAAAVQWSRRHGATCVTIIR